MLIKNGMIHVGDGKQLRYDLRISNDIISDLAENIIPDKDEEVFDAAGMEVMPGFVQPITNWGVNGSMQEIRPSSNDNDEKSNPITPELDGFYAFNGRAASAQQLGAFGLTACGVAPTDNNLFGGTIAAFEVEGVNPYKMCLKRDCAMMSSVTGSLKDTYGKEKKAPQTKMWIFANFSEQLRKASEYEVSSDEKGNKKDEKLIALKRVITGELPLFVSCDSKASAEHVWEIVRKYPEIKLVLVNAFGLKGDEQWIIENKRPVIVRFASSPMDENAMKLDLNAIVKLSRNGVPVALSGTYSNMMLSREDMLWSVSEMMRVVHNSNEVLPMLTKIPAQILGIDDKTGTIEINKRADIVIWSANPLETFQAHIIRTYQYGQIIYQKGAKMRCM